MPGVASSVIETGKYNVDIQLTKVVGYAVIQLSFNGVVLHSKINVFNSDKVVPLS